MLRSRLLLTSLLVTGAATAADEPRYAVTLDGQTLLAKVELCLAEAHAHVRFAADSEWAMRFVGGVARSSGGAVEDDDDGAWAAADWKPGECLSYHVDVGAVAAAHNQDVGWRVGDDLVVAPQLLLLRAEAGEGADAELSLDLPADWSISAPWREHADAARTRKHAKSEADARKNIHFTIPYTPSDWSAAVAFGHFSEERIPLPGGVLRLTILDGADAEERAKLHDWLAHVSRAILSAYGRLPLPDVQVLMIPLSGHGKAVMFGQSIRGQGNALELLVDPTQPVADFDKDWIAVHELSHLMHPYLGDRGSWLAEGLATYYQNVLRGRAGLLTPAQAWDRLREGFTDNAGKHYATSLSDAAATMHRTHDYRRVYWSGAAYWLTVDRDLRRDSDGKLELGLALSRFRDCCLPAHREWPPQEFVAKLDELAGVETFSRRYREFAALREFPEWEKVYEDLGVRTGEHIEFDPDAPDAAVRDRIMTAWSP